MLAAEARRLGAQDGHAAADGAQLNAAASVGVAESIVDTSSGEERQSGAILASALLEPIVKEGCTDPMAPGTVVLAKGWVAATVTPSEGVLEEDMVSASGTGETIGATAIEGGAAGAAAKSAGAEDGTTAFEEDVPSTWGVISSAGTSGATVM